MKPRILMFAGRSGCGKGTVIDDMKKELGSFCVVPVSRFLNAKRSDPIIGPAVSARLDSGRLVNDDITISVVKESVQWIDPGMHTKVFDGLPRTVPQADFCLKTFGRNHTLLMVVVNTEPNKCVERMIKRGRPGETREVIENRLATWHDTQLAVWYMKQSGVPTVFINGNLPLEQMLEDARSKIWPFFGRY